MAAAASTVIVIFFSFISGAPLSSVLCMVRSPKTAQSWRRRREPLGQNDRPNPPRRDHPLTKTVRANVAARAVPLRAPGPAAADAAWFPGGGSTPAGRARVREVGVGV